MADIKSTGVDYTSDEKRPAYDTASDELGIVIENVDDLKRRLSGRQMQSKLLGSIIFQSHCLAICDTTIFLPNRINTDRGTIVIAIGGSIGTALFVSIGSGLTQGGPGSLFIAF